MDYIYKGDYLMGEGGHHMVQGMECLCIGEEGGLSKGLYSITVTYTRCRRFEFLFTFLVAFSYFQGLMPVVHWFLLCFPSAVEHKQFMNCFLFFITTKHTQCCDILKKIIFSVCHLCKSTLQ